MNTNIVRNREMKDDWAIARTYPHVGESYAIEISLGDVIEISQQLEYINSILKSDLKALSVAEKSQLRRHIEVVRHALISKLWPKKGFDKPCLPSESHVYRRASFLKALFLTKSVNFYRTPANGVDSIADYYGHGRFKWPELPKCEAMEEPPQEVSQQPEKQEVKRFSPLALTAGLAASILLMVGITHTR